MDRVARMLLIARHHVGVIVVRNCLQASIRTYPEGQNAIDDSLKLLERNALEAELSMPARYMYL